MFDRIIAPSILAADFSCLGTDVRHTEIAGADWLHLDIMDGNFVPNISFGPAVVATIRRETKLSVDVQLMVRRSADFISPLKEAGADRITVHVESEHREGLQRTLALIRDHGCEVGLALNPETPLAAAEPYLSEVDLLLVMTVHSGFGGQAFLPETVEKIEAAYTRRLAVGMSFRIEVDGGVNLNTAGATLQAGADILVSGTALFRAPDMAAAIRSLRLLPGRDGDGSAADVAGVTNRNT